MRVSVKTSTINSAVELEVNEELRLSSLVMVAIVKLHIDGCLDEFFVKIGEKTFDTKKETTLKELNICDGDILILEKIGDVNNSLVLESPKGSVFQSTSNDKLLNHLIKSIRVSEDKNVMKHEIILAQHAKTLYDGMKNERVRDAVMKHFPQLVNIYDSHPHDLELSDQPNITIWFEKAISPSGFFISVFREQTRNASEKTKETQDLERRLERAIIDFPECFTKTPMLYLRAQLCATDVLALVDTGAQASVISNEAVEKCQMGNAVDKRFCVFASGVGGKRSSLGRILACDVLVSDMKLLCSFDVLPDDVCEIDIIIGLDVLSKNHAVVDVANRAIHFGSLGCANFIPPEEAEKLKPFKEPNTSKSNH